MSDLRKPKYPRFKYTDALAELYRVSIDLDGYVVVVGDPNNGSYEWIIETKGAVEQHSDAGYGMAAAALRDGLIAYLGHGDNA